MITKAREIRAILRQMNAEDRKLLAEEALVVWMDTVVPQSRTGAMHALMARTQFRLEEGQ
jgi:hypothetical protein